MPLSGESEAPGERKPRAQRNERGGEVNSELTG